MTARPVGIGLIGAGMVGQIAHLDSFARVPDCRLVALAELRPELGRQAAARFDVPRVYPSHHALLADPDVDAVVVVTRRPATGPIVLDALRAKKHVLSEKPMAHTVAQAERLVAAADAADRIYAVSVMKRFDPGVVVAQSCVGDPDLRARLGRLVRVRMWNFGGETGAPRDGFAMTGEERPEGLSVWPIAPDWLPSQRHSDYAWFLNVQIHLINLLRLFVPAPVAVTEVNGADGHAGTISFDLDGSAGVMEFGEGGSGEWREGIELCFERGTVRLDLPPPLKFDTVARLKIDVGMTTSRPAIPPGWSFRAQAEAFVAAIRSGQPPINAGRDCIEDHRIAEAIWRVQR